MGIHEYLEARDISPADVGPFLFLHTLLSAVLVGSTWWACYVGPRRPTELFRNEAMPSSLLLDSLVRIPGVSDGVKQKACRTLLSLEKASRNSRPVQYLERKIPSLDATRLCVSYAEAKFGRLFLKPLTVPGRIWLSWKGAKAWKQMKSGLRDDARGNERIDARATTIGVKSNAIFRRERRAIRPNLATSIR